MVMINQCSTSSPFVEKNYFFIMGKALIFFMNVSIMIINERNI